MEECKILGRTAGVTECLCCDHCLAPDERADGAMCALNHPGLRDKVTR